MLLVNQLDKHIREPIESGDTFMQFGNYELASHQYKNALKKSGIPKRERARIYKNLAQATILLDPFELIARRQAADYLERSIKLDPTNQTILILAAHYNTFTKDYKKVFHYLSQVNPSELIVDSSGIPKLIFKDLHTESLNNPKILLPYCDLLEDIYLSVGKHPGLADTLINVYISGEEFMKAFRLMEDVQTHFKNKPEVVMGLCVNFSLHCEKYPSEGIKLTKKGLELFQQQKKSVQRKNRNLGRLLETNLALNYIRNDQYSEAIELLKPKIIEHPNNTDIHNLAKAYLKMNHHDIALKYIDSALFLSKDEQGYYLKAEILFQSKKYEKALKYYIKAIQFLNSANEIHHFKDADGKNTGSINVALDKTKKMIYVGLANCYIALGEFVKAKSITETIKRDWPFDDELARLERNIEVLLNQSISMDEVKKEAEHLKQLLSKQALKHEKDIEELKGWALKVFRLQSEYIDREQAIDEDDWQAVMQEMHSIALDMKKEKNGSALYLDVKKKLQNKFEGISDKGLDFLATGEYLYQIHKENEIDFAPVMVEFSKVIETELNRHLAYIGLIDVKETLTLGSLNWRLRKINVESLSRYQDNLEKLIKFRNGSAHTGQSTREKVEVVRDLIMNTGWLDDILKHP